MGMEEFIKMVLSGWFFAVVGGTFIWATWSAVEWFYGLFRPKKRQFFVSFSFGRGNVKYNGSCIVNVPQEDMELILEKMRGKIANGQGVESKDINILSLNEVQ